MIRYLGKQECEILFITEPSNDSFRELFSSRAGQLIKDCAKDIGVSLKSCAFLSCSDEFPLEVQDSASREWAHMQTHREKFLKRLNYFKPKMCVFLGKYSGMQLLNNKNLKITKYSGIVNKVDGFKYPIMGAGSPRNIVKFLKGEDIFKSHFNMIAKLKDNDYIFREDMFDVEGTKYEWRVDISDVLKNKPKAIAFDTETTGLDWTLTSVYPIVFQLTFEDGHSICSPVSEDYFPEYFKEKFGDYDHDKLIGQWKELLEDPEVAKIGHNLKFDVHMAYKAGIAVENMKCDTLQLVFCVDENMERKSLDECVKKYVPEMRGYADRFNASVDKSNMIEVHPEDMILYAGGDTDATFRLAKKLYSIAKKDPSNLRVFNRVKMPALKSFVEMERNGIRFDIDKLEDISGIFSKELKELERECLKAIPKKILREYMWGINRKKKNEEEYAKASGVQKSTSIKEDPLRISNAMMVADTLFTEEGFGLRPRVFTKGTKKLADKDKVPKLDSKHLAYFEDEGIDFIRLYSEYSKMKKMSTTYIGDKEENKGFFKELRHNPLTDEYRVHSSFNIHTVTGRCLAEGTSVKLKRGKKNIEDIKVGDIVLTHAGNHKPVTKTYDNGKKEIMGLQFKDNSEIWGTFNHKLMDEKGKWKQMQYFDLGMKVKAVNASGHINKVIKGVMYNRNKKYTYDIEVKDDHSYIANGIISHNSNSKNPNVQNLPNRGQLAKTFKSCIIPGKGKVLLGLDYSQAEIRVVATAADETNMIDIYSKGLDIHMMTAAEVIRGMPVSELLKLSKEEVKQARQGAKATNFGFLYGMSAKKYVMYSKTDYKIDISIDEAELLRDRFLNKTYSKLTPWHESVKRFASDHGYIKSVHGSTRHLPAINSRDGYIRGEAEREAINSPIQEFASDLGLIAISNLLKDLKDPEVKIINFVHDALYFEVPIEKALHYAAAIKWYMENPPLKKMFGIKLPVPLVADCEIGFNLSEMQEIQTIERDQIKSVSKTYKFKDLDTYFNTVDEDLSLKAIKPDWCTL